MAADSEGTWQIGTDDAATIAASDFGQWSPTHADPDSDLWVSADGALMPVSLRALKRGVTQLAAVCSGERQVAALDVLGSVSCGSVAMAEAATVPGGDPGAGNGKFWVEDAAPTVPKFTDDTNVSHTLAYAEAPSYSRVTGSTARGSTNTLIYRWTTEAESNGSAITYADSAADGGQWTISEAGMYSVSVSQQPGGSEVLAIKVGTVTNTFDTAEIRAATNGSSSNVANLSWSGWIAAGSKVWVATSGSTDPTGSGTNYRHVTVAKIH